MSATATPTQTGMKPGRRIGKYEVLRHVATGGMAELYLARASGLENFEKLCVLKRILPSAAGDPQSIQMLLDEARIAATLHHSNIVQTYDIGQADGEYFICMEYLHGRNVAAISKMLEHKGLRFDEDSAMTIALGVCAGLHYAHDKTDDTGHPLGIVHRDVSPHNVIVTHDGGVKLVDFGLVKAETSAHTSRSGALKGKLAYMSPEQCRAKPVDRRSDVFALSIMLWELTTGERLYVGECDYDYLCAILEHDARTPRSIVPDYPVALEAIVMKGLQRDPALRWQSAEELQLQLEEYCRERRLKISPITLRRTMDELFGEELRAGSSSQLTAVDLASTTFAGSIHDLGSKPARPARTTTGQRTVAPRRRRLPIVLGVVAAALVAAAVVAFSGGGTSTSEVAPITIPTPSARPVASEERVAPEPEPPQAPIVTPSTEPPPEPPASVPVTATPATTNPTRTSRTKPTKPSKPTKPVIKKPDHDSLFPQ